MSISRRHFLGYTNLALASGLALPAMGRSAAPASLSSWLQSAEFSGFLKAGMEASHIPGLSLAVIDQGKLVHAAGMGFADLATKRPMTPNTVMNIASVTKTITGTAVMQMYEKGKLKLDAPVDSYLPFKVRNPAFPDRPITVRHLLTQTSSIADGPAYGKSYACGDPQVRLGDWLAQYFMPGGKNYDAALNFQSWAPGAQYGYSNVGFGLLGMMVERLSGMPFAEYCRKRIFKPLGMDQSRFLVGRTPREMHATPYTYVSDGNVSKVMLPEQGWSAAPGAKEMHVPHCLYSFVTVSDGLARSSAQEMARLLMAYAGGGAIGRKRILRPETIGAIFTDQRIQKTVPPGMLQGLTWHNLGDIWWHGGGDPGVSTFLALRPSDGRGVVLMANAGRSRIDAIAQRIFKWKPQA
jgi:CubicO group peptidase (beta-lactamase class C family)